ncbi:hyalin-like [Amphiura filiformis]|uniref:hyalin-like n=1 Tax=Amphiura filiformis TaxID=82378 RepID=UPI003B2216F3
MFSVGDTTVEYYWQVTNSNFANCIFAVSVILDQQSPSLNNCPTNRVVSSAQNVYWTDPTATDNIDPSPMVSCSPTSGYFFSTGVVTVTCTATDDANNANTCTFTVTVDQQSPSLNNCPTNRVVSSAQNVYWTDPTATDNIDPSPMVSCSPTSGYFFSTGVVAVTCTATDDANNANTCTFTVTVDQTPPTISCPADIMSSESVVNWMIPTASDDTDPVVDVSCSRTSDFSFPMGETRVTCTATDDAGNTVMCGFTVTILDMPATTAGHIDKCSKAVY